MEITINHSVTTKGKKRFPKLTNGPFISSEDIRFRKYLLLLEVLLGILFLFTIK